MNDNIHELSWLGVDMWATRGRLELGTNHALHIPIAHLPAMISNNVPLNEFSLRSDTSLNVPDPLFPSSSSTQSPHWLTRAIAERIGRSNGCAGLRNDEISSLRCRSDVGITAAFRLDETLRTGVRRVAAMRVNVS